MAPRFSEPDELLENHVSRKIVREFINVCCIVLTTPFWSVDQLLVICRIPQGTFCTFGQWLSLIPGAVGVWLRRAYYRMTLESCGVDFSIGFLSWIAHRNSRVGRQVYVGANCILGTVDLGSHILVGSNVQILSGRHQHNTSDTQRPISEQGGSFSRTRVGDNVWIGNSAVVMADIGSNAVVGAGSVVVKPVEPNWVVAGNPAQKIKQKIVS